MLTSQRILAFYGVNLEGGYSVSVAKKPVERRKHRRLSISNGAFVALRPHYQRIGQVVDISMGGLAFTYMADQESPNRSFEADIFLAGGVFCCQGVPFRTISDCESYGTAFSSIKMRRSGLQFGELTPQQQVQLERFIQEHTTPREAQP